MLNKSSTISSPKPSIFIASLDTKYIKPSIFLAGQWIFGQKWCESFLTNNAKKLNSKCLDLTYEELILTDFTTELNKTDDYQNIMVDKNKYTRNKKVLTYLENNPKISKMSGFDIVKKMKYKDILSKYFISKEFEDSLYQIKDENEPKEYIQFYIYTAKNYVKYFSKLTPRNYKKHNFEFVENLGEDDDEEEEESL